jgi:hypothetical protein
MLNLLVPSNNPDSLPTIVIPFGILLLVFAIRCFIALAWTHGRPGCSDAIFTLFATALFTAIVGGLSGVLLFSINDYSPALAWLALAAFILIAVVVYRRNEMESAQEHRRQEAWEARHKDDLCRYCDAYKTGDGEIHHTPTCAGR